MTPVTLRLTEGDLQNNFCPRSTQIDHKFSELPAKPNIAAFQNFLLLHLLFLSIKIGHKFSRYLRNRVMCTGSSPKILNKALATESIGDLVYPIFLFGNIKYVVWKWAEVKLGTGPTYFTDKGQDCFWTCSRTSVRPCQSFWVVRNNRPTITYGMLLAFNLELMIAWLKLG